MKHVVEALRAAAHTLMAKPHRRRRRRRRHRRRTPRVRGPREPRDLVDRLILLTQAARAKKLGEEYLAENLRTLALQPTYGWGPLYANKTLSGASRKPYVFVGDCTGALGRGAFISYLKHHGDQIYYEDMAKLCDLSPWEPDEGRTLDDDWNVSFWKSTTPSGIDVVYFVHSGIEHMFAPQAYASRFNAEEEDELAAQAEEDD